MRVGIYELRDPNGQDLAVQRAYEAILNRNRIPSVRLRAEQPDFWEIVDSLSLFIMRFSQRDTDLQQARDLLPIIERERGIKCYPNVNTGWHFDDKVKQYHLLRSLGFPMTECWIFYDRLEALQWIQRAAYPVVFKLRGGAGSQNVILVRNQRQARRLVNRMFGRGIRPESFLHPNCVRFKHFNIYREFHHLCGNVYRWSRHLDISPFWQTQKNYVLFQKFLPNNAWDTRVTVIGDRAFAFRRMVRDNDFRASGSGRIDYEPAKIDPQCLRIAFEISHTFSFQSMAYDFLTNEQQQPEFCEVSYACVSSAVYNCAGYWDTELKWHEGHFWPEYLHLADALECPDLRQPDLAY